MAAYLYLECPVCEWDCVLAKSGSEMGLSCPLCAGDSGRGVYLRSRDATDDDRPEGADERQQAPSNQGEENDHG